jgi:PPOX class probable F420-dependent enzyme
MFPGSDHAKKRLGEDLVAWLTTVDADGRPSTAPVWFLLEPDDTIVLFSRDPSVRVDNVRTNDRVTLALNSDPPGHDIVVVNGRANIDDSCPSVANHDTYLAKYRPSLEANTWSPQWFAERYPTAIRITPTSVTGR